MANKALTGKLGDVGDWLAAEIRWTENGITKDDLVSMSAERWPFDAAIRDVGFPTALRFLPVMIEPGNSNEPVDELLDIFHAVPDGDTNTFVASAINWSLLVSSLPFGRDRTFVPPDIDSETLQSIYEKVPPGSPVPGGALLTIMDDLGHDLLDFVEKVQRLNFQFTFNGQRGPNNRDIAEILRDSYIKHSRNPALLPLLSDAAQQKVFVGNPIDVQKPEAYGSPESKTAALLINLAQESWETDCVDEWILTTQSVAAKDSDVYDQIISTLRGNQVAGLHLGKYLNELGRLIPSSQFQTNAAHVDLLENILSKRTSKFDDVAAAGQFNLPSGIVQPTNR